MSNDALVRIEISWEIHRIIILPLLSCIKKTKQPTRSFSHFVILDVELSGINVIKNSIPLLVSRNIYSHSNVTATSNFIDMFYQHSIPLIWSSNIHSYWNVTLTSNRIGVLQQPSLPLDSYINISSRQFNIYIQIC